MAKYNWRGRNGRGEAVSGEMEAETPGAVADQLLGTGVIPVNIALSKSTSRTNGAEGSAVGWWTRMQRKPVVEEDIMTFSRQMYTLNKAGVPMLQALSGLQASPDKPAMGDLLKDISSSLDQGRELSSALNRHTTLFSPFYIEMVKVGELTGRLSEVFLNLSQHLEFQREIRARIKQAMRYPTFVMIAISVAIVVLNIFVIPTFAKVFAGYKAELPLITRGLLGFSNWMVSWWPMLFIVVFGGIFLIKRYLRTPAGRYVWDERKLKLPIMGNLIKKATLARFARSLALSLQSGVPLVHALSVVSQAVDNAFVGARIEQMRIGLERGDTISRCARATGIFTPMVIQMIQVGEETGALDDLLFEIADMYERDTDHAMKGLSAAIEPILLVIIGAIVLLLALGIFMPMWQMGSAAKSK